MTTVGNAPVSGSRIDPILSLIWRFEVLEDRLHDGIPEVAGV